METLPVPRSTVTALIVAYQHAETQIRQAFDLLESAKSLLDSTFISGTGYYFTVNDSRSGLGVGQKAADAQMATLKQDAWRAIVDKLELRKILSIKRREELDAQLYDNRRYSGSFDGPKPLPEITEENVLAMFQDAAAKAPEYAREAVYEVFDWLRPHGDYGVGKLKTNSKWKIGKKIITSGVEPTYNGMFRVSHYHNKNFTALDNVFHMLDGKGALKTHNGPLNDAIMSATDGTGSTDYFDFKLYQNHNIHITFKRVDLVDKINKMAGNRSQIGN